MKERHVLIYASFKGCLKQLISTTNPSGGTNAFLSSSSTRFYASLRCSNVHTPTLLNEYLLIWQVFLAPATAPAHLFNI